MGERRTLIKSVDDFIAYKGIPLNGDDLDFVVYDFIADPNVVLFADYVACAIKFLNGSGAISFVYGHGVRLSDEMGVFATNERYLAQIVFWQNIVFIYLRVWLCSIGLGHKALFHAVAMRLISSQILTKMRFCSGTGRVSRGCPGLWAA
jgi:hypothetical protein